MIKNSSASSAVLRAYGLSHTGLVRSENEDTIYFSPEEGLFVLADGMGGHSSGRNASEKAVAVIRQYLTEQRLAPKFQWPFDPSPNLSDLENHASIALRIANVRVYNEAQKNEDLHGMGTTGLLFIADGEHGVVAHVGDSRCYVHDGKTLQKVTNDHSLVNQLMRVFNLSEDEASEKAGKNVLVQSIGIDDDIVPDIASVNLSTKQTLLLCSDGLTDMLSDPEIQTILEKPNLDLKDKTERLIKASNKAGGRDNISVILIAVSP